METTKSLWAELHRVRPTDEKVYRMVDSAILLIEGIDETFHDSNMAYRRKIATDAIKDLLEGNGAN